MEKRSWLIMIMAGWMAAHGWGILAPGLAQAEEPVSEDAAEAPSPPAEESRELFTGMINSFDGEGVLVIGDVTLQYGNATRFYNRSGIQIAVSSLKVGDFVGYYYRNEVLDEVREMDRDAVRGRSPSHSPAGTTPPPAQDTPIQMEDGVYKN